MGEESGKKSARFVLKSHRLAKPCMYDFDIYVRAAVEIQKVTRGFLYRKKFGQLKYWREDAIKIQKTYREYQAWRNNKVINSLKQAKTLEEQMIKVINKFHQVIFN